MEWNEQIWLILKHFVGRDVVYIGREKAVVWLFLFSSLPAPVTSSSIDLSSIQQ
jgi:hypothetical protein